MIRAFIAIALDTTIADTIADAAGLLRPQFVGVRWIAPSNLHLTLKFLGGIDETMIEPIGSALDAQLRLFQPFAISAKGLGVFPDPKRPRVLWVGLIGDHLVSLASTVESALQPLGFAPESRKFTPHLTIGRWRQADAAPKSLVRQLKNWQAHEFGTSNVERVNVIQSVLNPAGARYYPLVTVPLGAERTTQ